MSAKSELSAELKNAIVWLERQPGVGRVVQGRYVRTNHNQKIGFVRIVSADDRHVHLRVFDKIGAKELFVYAPESKLRESWVALVATGNVIGQNGTGPKVAAVAPKEPPKLLHDLPPHVPAPPPEKVDAAQIFMVTPELAASWLERNTRNRKLRDSRVARYAAAMKAGRWRLTNDAIAFDTGGNIIEGQHRLWAVLESGATVPMLVVFGLDPDVIKVVGDSLPRSVADVATINRPGSTVSHLHTAIANLILQTSIASTAVDKRQALQRIDRETQLDALDRHRDAIEFTFRDCFRSQKLRGITTAPVLTPVTRAYYSHDRDRLIQFGRIMLTGLIEDPASDQSAILLRNMLTRATADKVRPTPDVIYRKTERALAAFLDGSKIATLYEASNELFPLPEDKRPKGR